MNQNTHINENYDEDRRHPINQYSDEWKIWLNWIELNWMGKIWMLESWKLNRIFSWKFWSKRKRILLKL